MEKIKFWEMNIYTRLYLHTLSKFELINEPELAF